jgi:hypothetical protein
MGTRPGDHGHDIVLLSHPHHEVSSRIIFYFLIFEIVALASQVLLVPSAVPVLSFNIPIMFMMLSTIAKATVLLALLPSATRALPGAHLDVPWKKSGLFSGSAAKAVIKRDSGYPTGCNHGPATRSCWKDNYNVDTDMDLEWPTTGVLRKVSC